ncbi:DUF3310 domain-containing protein [Listeria monocytogenes]|uniref:DUF3310 domain-containing protein n=1 Tax=Listeria monocytogenes TaxID=1639 RepID=UPI000B587CAF|nr:DUF3310 domain-containing protein [Listeria monocytogenes]MBC6176323.1 DUF3310 domain-containing protein [Listeria welshimeri]ASH35196.1 conserved hypothetical phage protein [Listeria monocytogenes serotype 1/2b str. 10-0810]ASH38167.1 conserved hypothetical phage protein [Listeria monocytogenes serotype 1/2b str. 10-0811]EAC7689707.1 DUF3310 domain-containing protein [Listeria monocytogenes]EHG7524640.1 DUF3310 domain-containing protein [Listeria monocytogenes]
MRTVIQLASVNDYVGYMVYMHKKGYKWADGTPLVPVSLARYHKYGHGTYVREFHESKEIRWLPNNYIELTPGTEVIPYIEKTNYFDTHEPIKCDLPSEKESRVIKQEAFDALVKPQYRMDDTKDQYRIVKKEYTTVNKDEISQPSHYTTGGIEPIKFIQSHNMNFEKGNVIKYVTRAGKKEGQKEVKDLKKARQYLDFLITKLEDEEK